MSKDLILNLYNNQMIKFGEFTLKSGKNSYVYADIRTAISYPVIFKQICNEYQRLLTSLNYDLICGVPYSALTFATAIAYANQTPMLLKRKEAKDYGTKKLLEGAYSEGQTCVVLEDVITTGASIIETIDVLESFGLKVTDVCSLINRDQGGRELLSSRGYQLHSVMDLAQIIEVLYQENKITETDKKQAISLLGK